MVHQSDANYSELSVRFIFPYKHNYYIENIKLFFQLIRDALTNIYEKILPSTREFHKLWLTLYVKIRMNFKYNIKLHTTLF